MCGICGTIDFTDHELIKKMCRCLAHRGPDDEGYFIDKDAALGIRRLSIIDLNTGNQPIHNENETVWIVFNGEIYNFKELGETLKAKGHKFYTKTDTEVIVHLYEEYGKDCVQHLLGMFAFAIWDKANKRLMLARDRTGKKPLYYTQTARGLIFASEIKSLLQDSGVKREVNPASLFHYLTFNYVPLIETMFAGIVNLPPASILLYENKSIKVEEYWDLHFDEDYSHNEQYWLEKIEERLNESVKLRLVSDVPLGVFLSGGLDSSVILALMSRFMHEPVKTFSVSFKGPQFYDESRDFRLVANLFKADHHELSVEGINAIDILPKLVWHFDEPFADPVALPTYLISKFASQYVKVVLTGDGGDEAFAGYLRYPVDNFASLYRVIPKFIRDMLIQLAYSFPTSNRLRKALRGLSEPNEAVRYSYWVAQMPDETKHKLYPYSQGMDSSFNLFLPLFEKQKDTSSLNRRLYVELKNWLGNVHLKRLDRTSMANSLEARCPLLDWKLIELCARLPHQLKLKGFVTKYALKKIARRLLPAQIVDKKKHGFTVPISYWLRRELRSFAYDVLTDARARKRGYFDTKYVQVMLDEHSRGRSDFGTSIWALLNFELWHRMFIDQAVTVDSAGVSYEMAQGLAAGKSLFIAVDFPPVGGGESVYGYNICKHLPADKMIVLAPVSEGAQDFDKGLDFRMLRISQAWCNVCARKIAIVLKLLFSAKRILKREKIKEIQCLHLLSTGTIGYILNKITGVPYYVYIFGAEFRQHRWLNWLKRKILDHAKAILPIAEFIKSEAINAGVKNRNFIKINPGVNLDIFHPGINCETLIRRYRLEGKKIILTVARFDRNKGVDMAIQSLSSVLDEVPNAVYLVLGSGPCEQEWRQLAKRTGLEEKVIFGGFVSNEELPVYYNACDVFLLATRTVKELGFVEGFGIVFIEANACGKPVIAGNVGGVSEAVIDGVTGILVDPLNTQEISNALIKLLTDGGLARKLGEAGRRRAEEEFSWQVRIGPLKKALT